jgi:hypothetical protein
VCAGVTLTVCIKRPGARQDKSLDNSVPQRREPVPRIKKKKAKHFLFC